MDASQEPSYKSGERATYSFEELIDRLSNCESKDELAIYKTVAFEERYQYSIFHNKLIIHAFWLMEDYLNK